MSEKSNPSWDKKQREAFQKAWAKIIAKAWSDAAYKQRLLKDPTGVLKENGIKLPEGMSVRVNESTDKVIQLVLPKKPHGELSVEELEGLAAAGEIPWTPLGPPG
jgi:hypothetical protein